MFNSKSLSLALILVALITLLSGCAFTRMETAGQLDHGEVMAGATFDIPGFLYIPKAGGYVMVGVGDVADISAHAATTITGVNGGAGTRLYLGDNFTFSLQGDYTRFFIYEFQPTGDSSIITATPRIYTTTNEQRFFYGGLQANILTGLDDGNFDFFGAAIGALGGIDYMWSNGVGFQTEALFQPITIGPGGLQGLFSNPESEDNAAAIASFQFSLGFYYRPMQRKRQERERRPQPSSPYLDYGDEDEDDSRPAAPQPQRPSESEPERDEEPEYDDQGVPLY